MDTVDQPDRMSSDQDPEGHRLASALDDYLLVKSKKNGTGNYRRNAERVINEWIDWTKENRTVYTFESLDVADLEAYALHLKRRANDPDGIAASTANKYYDYVRAYLSWCSQRSYPTNNPAAHERALDALPDDSSRDQHRQQLWSPEQRRAIVDYVEERAREAIEERGTDAVQEARDRAFVMTIAYSGARGGELVRDPHDARRTGLRWKDVDLDNGTAVVLDKDQEFTEASLPPQAVTALDRYRMALDPPTEDWPLFPTKHRPTLFRTARDALAGAGLSDEEVEERLEEDDVDEILRDLEVPPPAITTDGARSLMKRLTADAGVPGIDPSEGEYLEPHGGRRGAGDTLVREVGWEAAQNLLRHNSPEVTIDAYSHISASETAESAGEAFEKTDTRPTEEN